MRWALTVWATCAACAHATVAADLVPFVLPYDDGAPGPTDLSTWSHRPAGKLGRIRVTPDGHLALGGRRVRLLGVNCCSTACWPDRDKAPKIAARLAKFGVNCVRFHHMDARFGRPQLLRYAKRTSRELDPQVLDRLDYFIAQLTKHGIYVNLNLLVSRTFFARDGLPASIETLGWKDQHRLGFFDAKLLELQKEYARRLLLHRNPYTKRTYAEDPAVAMVEICNENGLVASFLQGKLDELPEPYASGLREQWNVWLAKRYASTADLRRAWKARAEPPGASVLANGDFAKGMSGWHLEQHEGARATARVDQAEEGRRALRIDVTRLGSAGWHVQLTGVGFGVKGGAIYTLTFSARADRACRISAGVRQADRPWGSLGLRYRADLTRRWRRFQTTFVATKDEPNARVDLTDLGARRGTYWIADVSLKPGGSTGLDPALRLEAGTVPTLKRHTTGAVAHEATGDWVRFLADVESAYWLTV